MYVYIYIYDVLGVTHRLCTYGARELRGARVDGHLAVLAQASIYIYIYIYICTHMSILSTCLYLCIYIYIYIYADALLLVVDRDVGNLDLPMVVCFAGDFSQYS